MTLMESISRNISRWEGRGGRGDVGGGSGECEYAGEKKGGHLCIYIYESRYEACQIPFAEASVNPP